MISKVFIHGNPETTAIWDDLVEELMRRGVADIVRLSPPGFGAPTPANWGATAGEYRDWLIRELDRIDGEVDVVAHDWGAGHLFGALAARPSLVRTWAADCAGLLHGEYVWHDAAQAWQAPEVGEQAVEGFLALDEDTFVAAFASLGMTAAIAAAVKRGLNDETGRCVLALYRSAAQPFMADLGRRFTNARPPGGLVIIAEDDHYAGTPDMMQSVADSVGARTERIPSCGHWWMIQNPSLAADILIDHWSRDQAGG